MAANADESMVTTPMIATNNNIDIADRRQGHTQPAQSEAVQQQEEEMIIGTHSAKNYKKWNRRLRVFFCCLGYKKNKDSIADVASIFAEFYADLPVRSSDIAAGFILLSKYQEIQRQWIVKNQQLGVEKYLSSVPITEKTSYLDIGSADDSYLVNDLIYYMNYSLAIFGWPLHLVESPCMLCCLCPYLRFCRCASRGSKKSKTKTRGGSEKPTGKKKTRVDVAEDKGDEGSKNKEERLREANNDEAAGEKAGKAGGRQPGRLADDCDAPIILEDNCCGCNRASFECRLSAHNYEIIYINYRVNVNKVPFLVVADHSKRTIVVALRGSMGLADMVTDMNGQADRLLLDDCPDDWLCHRGIMRASDYVKTTLIQERILDMAFNCRPDLGSSEYNLILCGHSLGAGVAAILGILLRPLYPTLKAYLYSPPGGLLSLPAVEYSKQFAIGVILGNDCVPRLGLAQLERLRYQMLLSLKSSQRSSKKVVARALCPNSCFGDNHVDYDPDQSLNLLYGTEGRPFDYRNRKIRFQVQQNVLYVPGRIIHVVKNDGFESRARRLFKGPIYQAVWTENTDYDRIMISDGMFVDHLPTNLMHAMKMLFSRTLPGRRDSKLLAGKTSQNGLETGPVGSELDLGDSHVLPPTKQIIDDVINDDNNNNTHINEPEHAKISRKEDEEMRHEPIIGATSQLDLNGNNIQAYEKQQDTYGSIPAVSHHRQEQTR